MNGAAKTVAACLLAGVAIGCGTTHKAANPSSDRARVDTVLRSYLRAQAQGDGTTACALLTPAAQNQLIGLVVKAGKGLIPGTPSCGDAVALVRAVAGPQLLSALETARVEQVQLGGSAASARVVDGTAFKPQQVSLEKTGGNWKIAGVPSLVAGPS